MFVGNESIDLELALMDSAQCFLWKRVGNRFGAVIAGTPIYLERREDGVYAQGGTRQLLRDYLDLDRDYASVAANYAHLPIARRVMELYPGLRVLNQDPWSALVTFIISANNNVSRIRKICDALARSCGKGFETPQGMLFALPSPQELAACSEDRLRATGMGYRAPYLLKTARRVADGFPLGDLCKMEYAEAHARLTELPGVGDKVADCVLLFGCRHASAFPVDTWVEKLLKNWFGIEGSGRSRMQKAARELFGEEAGLLQQFLFHAARTGGIELSIDQTKEG